MKIIILILSLGFFQLGISQEVDTSFNIQIKTIKGSSIEPFIDSIKSKIYQDTTKFNRLNLLHTIIGTRNSKAYSPLYVVNSKYAYKLDIINGTLVNDFVKNILKASTIDSIEIMGASYCQYLFGSYGMNGAIFIWIKKKEKINYKIAGLVKNKRRNNNFFQRQKGELMILE